MVAINDKPDISLERFTNHIFNFVHEGLLSGTVIDIFLDTRVSLRRWWVPRSREKWEPFVTQM